MAVSYKELGLVNTKEMFADAMKNGYAVPAYNFNNLEQIQAIVQACAETKSPVILQVSKGARNYANATILRYLAMGAVEYAKEGSDRIRFPQIATTRMACPDMSGERELLQTLEHVERFGAAEDNAIALFNEVGERILLLKKK